MDDIDNIDDIDNVDEPVTYPSRSEYEDDDDEDGYVAVGSDNDDYEDKDDKENDEYYENSADPFVEHTSEHTVSTTEKEPVIFATTPAPTFIPRIFTTRKPTTLFWRPSAPTTTTSTTTSTTTTTTTTSTTTTKPTTTTSRATRTTTTPRTTTSSTDNSRSRTLPDSSSSEGGEKRIGAVYPSPVETITQSVPRAQYGAVTTTGDTPSSIVGEGVDSRANGEKGYGLGVNSRDDADHTKLETESIGGGRPVYKASGRLFCSQSLLSVALAILSILPVLL
uniref:Uncharacterized protein n=1 Tax=Plectus sambesii TaxID=2011161 RepID=A0A914WHP7_9BILA